MRKIEKGAELKLLQSKINPHFIYNIFNNMSWLLELEKYDDLREMIDSVAKYHKTSLNYGSDFIRIADNVEQLKSYAKIQMIRFKNKFNCEFEIDPRTLDINSGLYFTAITGKCDLPWGRTQRGLWLNQSDNQTE